MKRLHSAGHGATKTEQGLLKPPHGGAVRDGRKVDLQAMFPGKTTHPHHNCLDGPRDVGFRLYVRPIDDGSSDIVGGGVAGE